MMVVLLEILCTLWIVASVNGQTGKERTLKIILNQWIELYESCCVLCILNVDSTRTQSDTIV